MKVTPVTVKNIIKNGKSPFQFKGKVAERDNKSFSLYFSNLDLINTKDMKYFANVWDQYKEKSYLNVNKDRKTCVNFNIPINLPFIDELPYLLLTFVALITAPSITMLSTTLNIISAQQTFGNGRFVR